MRLALKALFRGCAAVTCVALVASCAWNDVSIEQRGAPAVAGGAGGSGGTVEDAGEFTRADVLDAFAECALNTYEKTLERAQALEQVLASPDADVHGSAARDAWVSMMAVWEEAEVMQFGPAAITSLPGGQELRDNIYSWPVVSRCLIDQQLVTQGYAALEFATSLVSMRGLGALEYLLFHDATDNGCAATATINTSGSWVALAQAELLSRKLAYARVVAGDVRGRVAALVEAWQPDGGNFVAQFRSAGAGSTVYVTDQAALNSVSDAIFYVEKEVKDMKLARPLGIDAVCATSTCPELLESRFARRSKQHIQNNLVAFKKLFVGCGADFAGLGFEDLLVAMGRSDLAAQMRSDLERSISAGRAIEENDLALALAADYASVKAWHVALQPLSDALKADFLSVLDLDLPKRAATDND